MSVYNYENPPPYGVRKAMTERQLKAGGWWPLLTPEQEAARNKERGDGEDAMSTLILRDADGDISFKGNEVVSDTRLYDADYDGTEDAGVANGELYEEYPN